MDAAQVAVIVEVLHAVEQMVDLDDDAVRPHVSILAIDRVMQRDDQVDEPPGDLRIRVAGAGVNRADLLQRRGMYPPPPGASPLLGLECAGEVIEVGARVTGWRAGDRAMALLAGGGYAEAVVVDAGSALPVPRALSDAEAAALPEVYLTVFLNVFQLGALPPGGSLLEYKPKLL